MEREGQIKFYIANTLAGLDYVLSDNDIVFTYTLSSDVDKETKKVDKYYIAVLTEEDILYNFLVSFDDVYVSILKIVKTSIISVAPMFADYNFDEPIARKSFEEFDHLSISFDKIHETITLYGHTYEGNKPLKDVARNLIRRLK